jgi:3-deoxy-D-manno-octulosonic-acid transferase
MLAFFYTVGVTCYHAAIRAVAPFHAKAAAWARGRRGLWKRIEGWERGTGRLVWFHAASLGEFEQGRPLMEALRAREPGTRVLLTFFSPSGYEARANYDGADAVFYLPPDSPRNVRRFLRATRPDAAVFIKYEFWYHYLRALHRDGVPTYLVSAIFRPGQPFFRRWGALHRRMLGFFTSIFVQDEASARLLASAGAMRVTVAGDTRFDRVLEIAAGASVVERVARFRGEGALVVCGSTWPADEEMIARYIRARGTCCRWVIVPHEVGEARVRALLERLGPDAARFSEGGEEGRRVLVIDRVGLLSSVYRHATVAYIGGGFGRGIHNALEAAVYGIPVVFGPRYLAFREAVGLVARGGGFPVSDAREFTSIMDELLAKPPVAAEAGRRAGEFVSKGAGATARVLAALEFRPYRAGTAR